jgi:CSLREA domain-containing protein
MSFESLKVHSAAFALAALCAAGPAGAAVFLPTTTTDTADGVCDTNCSLRDAITAANQAPGFDVIVLGPGVYAASGSGNEDLNASGDLDILDDLAIIGDGADQTNIEGSAERVLDIAAGATVEIIGVKISNGRQLTGNGGGIRNAGQLTLTRVQVSGNSANGGAGGGIFSDGTGSSLTVQQSSINNNVAAGAGGGIAVGQQITLTDSTLSGNNAGTTGGGIHSFDNTDGEIVGATITANQAGTQGGGIYTVTTPFITVDRPELRNTILAGNTAPADRDCGGSPSSGGENLVGVGSATCNAFTAAKGDLIGTTASPLDPKLGPLTNNGGSTPTHALLAGSPAIDAADDCTASDQRGVARPAACDIGAFELSAACVTGGPTLCLSNERFKITVEWKTAQGVTGKGQAVQLTSDTGYFWFFNASNIELTIKVLNGCSLNNRYWVFLSGLTNVEVTVTVTDTATGQTKTYKNPQRQVFKTVLDTGAFASCS